MRHFIIYITILTLHLNSASGQTRIILDGSNRIDTSTRPLVLVDTFKTDITHLVITLNWRRYAARQCSFGVSVPIKTRL